MRRKPHSATNKRYPPRLERPIRLRGFIAETNPQAALRAAERITSAIDQLATFPLVGRPCPEEYLPTGFRELVISFRQDGYVVLYRVVHSIG